MKQGRRADACDVLTRSIASWMTRAISDKKRGRQIEDLGLSYACLLSRTARRHGRALDVKPRITSCSTKAEYHLEVKHEYSQRTDGLDVS